MFKFIKQMIEARNERAAKMKSIEQAWYKKIERLIEPV